MHCCSTTQSRNGVLSWVITTAGGVVLWYTLDRFLPGDIAVRGGNEETGSVSEKRQDSGMQKSFLFRLPDHYFTCSPVLVSCVLGVVLRINETCEICEIREI